MISVGSFVYKVILMLTSIDDTPILAHCATECQILDQLSSVGVSYHELFLPLLLSP